MAKWLVLIGLFISLSSRAGGLEIRTGHPGATVRLTGYSGLRELALASLVADGEGVARYNSDYRGFILTEINNLGVFPVIVMNGPVTFSFGAAGEPGFTDPENIWFYDALKKKKQADSLSGVVGEDLDSTRADYRKRVVASGDRISAILLQGQLVLESSYGIRSREDLDETKKIMLDFLSGQFDRLYHSDMFRQMAFQYAMMNEYVAQSREEHYGWVLTDIGDWMTLFRGRLSPEEITGFFTEMAVNRRMISLASEIVGKFGEYGGCPVGSTGSGLPVSWPGILLHAWKESRPPVPLGEAGPGKKLLIFYDEECLFSLPGHVRMMGLLEKNNLELPVVTVFSGRRSPPEADELVLPRRFSLWFRDDPAEGRPVCSRMGIRKFPAFLILDDNGINSGLFYSSDEALQAILLPGK